MDKPFKKSLGKRRTKRMFGLFSKMNTDRTWYFSRCFDTKEEAVERMEELKKRFGVE